jgi:hypothetical protein
MLMLESEGDTLHPVRVPAASLEGKSSPFA